MKFVGGRRADSPFEEVTLIGNSNISKARRYQVIDVLLQVHKTTTITKQLQ